MPARLREAAVSILAVAHAPVAAVNRDEPLPARARPRHSAFCPPRRGRGVVPPRTGTVARRTCSARTACRRRSLRLRATIGSEEKCARSLRPRPRRALDIAHLSYRRSTPCPRPCVRPATTTSPRTSTVSSATAADFRGRHSDDHVGRGAGRSAASGSRARPRRRRLPSRRPKGAPRLPDVLPDLSQAASVRSTSQSADRTDARPRAE